MLETVKDLLQEVDSFIPKSEKEVEDFRLKFLGKKGKMNELFAVLIKYHASAVGVEVGIALRTDGAEGVFIHFIGEGVTAAMAKRLCEEA